jgi:hypothetical protein
VKDRRRRLAAVSLLVTILGPQVTSRDFDQAAATTAFAHVAVKR